MNAGLEKRLTHVIKMPVLENMPLSEKQRMIVIKDQIIFKELLDQHRTIVDQTEGAEAGNYILIKAADPNGKVRMLHIELGGNQYPELEVLLPDCRAGQSFSGVIFGETMTFTVESVRKVVEMKMDDESIQKLGIAGVCNLMDYRRYYIEEHSAEITEKVFDALYDKMVDYILKQGIYEIDPEDLQHYNNVQREMLQNLSGDADARILESYRNAGATTMEEAQRMFLEENRENYINYIWAKELAKENKMIPSEKDVNAEIEEYSSLCGLTPEKIKEQGRTEEAMYAYYFDYGIKQLLKYYRSIVRFSAEGIPSMAGKY